MIDIADALGGARIPFREYGVTAVDSYCGLLVKQPLKFYLTEGSIVDLACAFEALRFPSLPYADAAVDEDDASMGARFLCVEDIGRKDLGAHPLTDFRRNPVNGQYYDPKGVYRALRDRSFEPGTRNDENSLFETAVYLSRLVPSTPVDFDGLRFPAVPSPLWQKDLLSLILQGSNSAVALEFLKDSGFVALHWPELAALLLVDHSKDCHPEGGGWSHTMEALGYRKSFDLSLSLAILLHDIGKPRSESVEGRRFDRHAEIGSVMAARFLSSLGFDDKTIDDVRFMIRWHMMPAALPRIPLSRVQNIVFDPRFPVLLELYRCDEFSTFKGPDAYYATCAAYKSILRNRKNPYRDSSGRKIPKAFYSVRS
ncbi:MAG: HD domain-containing protein [Spirochaetes bacterium]|nr:HD domain-containing protein [Spirochaetota bacterium]